MGEILLRIAISAVCAVLFCLMTFKAVGAMQQGGYRNRSFLRWFKRGDNLYFNRLCVLSLCLFLTSALTSLCFSFLGVKWALALSALPFFIFLGVFIFVDFRYALKVPAKLTGRFFRLFFVYWLFTAIVGFLWITFLAFLSDINGSVLYALLAYTPFAVMPMTLPFLLCAANGVTRIFENARNDKFVLRAKKTLDNSDIIRVGIVGSFGKTSVKNILRAILSEKFQVVQTPESYNTPIGIAKTVFSEEFAQKQVLIAEMGARKTGDIAELCELIRPDFAVFTGVCEQHISSFKSLENVFAEKSEIIKCGAKVVCSSSLKTRVEKAFGQAENVTFVDSWTVEDMQLSATQTKFSISLGEEKISVCTKLLGRAAVENILLAATLAYQMGMSAEEIQRGIENIQAVPHRLQLIESGGVYILDDGYNCNPRGATEALAALSRFEGRKCIVTPGMVDCGVLEEKLNSRLGAKIAAEQLDYVILVGDTLVGIVKKGYLIAGGKEEKLAIARSLDDAKVLLKDWLQKGDAVLFLNDLPDVY